MITKDRRRKHRVDRSKSADLTVSSKRQVTLPAAMMSELGISPGDKIVAIVEDGDIVLKPRPQSWLDYVTSLPVGYYGRTKEEVDAYLAEVREGWDERLEEIERIQSDSDQ